MNRKERRAAAHQTLKLARKAGFPTEQPQPPQPTTNSPATPAIAPSAAGSVTPVAIAAPPSAAADIAIPPSVATDIPEPGTPFPILSSLTPRRRPPLSAARFVSNRANAKYSTGPTSDSGRAISSQNRTTHGLARHNCAFVLLASEDSAGFEALKAALAAEHQPTTETEAILINTMAESHWLANRAQYLQTVCFDQETGLVTDLKTFSLYLRYQTTHTRAFHKSLNDLLELRAEKRKNANGFEAQTRKQEELRIQNEKHEMKKQAHYWDVLRKDAEACFQIGANTTQQVKAAKEDPGFQAQYAAELAKRGLESHPTRVATAA